MVDREKAIKGLQCLSNPYIQDMDERDCENCQYDNACCFLDVTADALSLLKAQEPKRMIGISEFDENISVGRCTSCDQTIVNNNKHPIRFCKYCGQAVKWE